MKYYGYKKTTYERKGGGMVNHKHTEYKPILDLEGWIMVFLFIFGIAFIYYTWWLIPIVLIICLCCKNDKKEINEVKKQENIKQEDKIGNVVIKYNENNMGSLALNIDLDLDLTIEEINELQNLITELNEIIIPSINKSKK